MNGRVYDPTIGRFISVDPVFQFPENTQSLNPYSYVLNNPLGSADPTGFMGDSLCDHGSNVGASGCGAGPGLLKEMTKSQGEKATKKQSDVIQQGLQKRFEAAMAGRTQVGLIAAQSGTVTGGPNESQAQRSNSSHGASQVQREGSSMSVPSRPDLVEAIVDGERALLDPNFLSQQSEDAGSNGAVNLPVFGLGSTSRGDSARLLALRANASYWSNSNNYGGEYVRSMTGAEPFIYMADNLVGAGSLYVTGGAAATYRLARVAATGVERRAAREMFKKLTGIRGNIVSGANIGWTYGVDGMEEGNTALAAAGSFELMFRFGGSYGRLFGIAKDLEQWTLNAATAYEAADIFGD